MVPGPQGCGHLLDSGRREEGFSGAQDTIQATPVSWASETQVAPFLAGWARRAHWGHLGLGGSLGQVAWPPVHGTKDGPGSGAEGTCPRQRTTAIVHSVRTQGT